MDPATAATFESVLDFSAPLNVEVLDHIVNALYTGSAPLRQKAEAVMTTFQEHPEAWSRADSILENAKLPQTKFFALQILERLIKSRWKIVPEEHRLAIKGYVVAQIIKISSEPALPGLERQFLLKFNLVLVQILKQDWPHDWPSFITEIVAASRSSIPLCTNNMVILRLLSEEIFDFSKDQLTQTKQRHLRSKLCNEFSSIFQLCQEVLETADVVVLLDETLSTLMRYISWIPQGFIFQTNLIAVLTQKLIRIPQLRKNVVSCLTEIIDLKASSEEFGECLVNIFPCVVSVTRELFPDKDSIVSIYDESPAEVHELVHNITLFLTSFLSNYLNLAERECNEALHYAHLYLLEFTKIEDSEVFKVTLEYWTRLFRGLYEQEINNPAAANGFGYGNQGFGSSGDHGASGDFGLRTSIAAHGGIFPMNNQNAGAGMANSNPNSVQARISLYCGLCTELLPILILRMARPEEVIVVEDEEGNVIRDKSPELDAITLYNNMRNALVYMTHSYPILVTEIMSSMLRSQFATDTLSATKLGKLSWAMGSISGALMEVHERNFLVEVLRELLTLMEVFVSKNDKALAAAAVMYVVGQHPRFLRANRKFFKVVIHKLFDFMHERHEGVREMSCDTFIKIARETKRTFVEMHQHEPRPFIDEILGRIEAITCNLETKHLQVVYEGIGHLISAVPSRENQELMIEKLMQLPNTSWDNTMSAAASGIPVLENEETVTVLVSFLRVNSCACTSIGPAFRKQMMRIYIDMLGMYCAASGAINSIISKATNMGAVQMPVVKGLRCIKKEVLKLVQVYTTTTDQLAETATELVPQLLNACLGDYAQNPPQARDAEVLHVIADVINRLRNLMSSQILPILNSVFACTLEMINKELVEYPEHRSGFFRLLAAAVKNCSAAVLALPYDMFNQVINSIVWGFKHTMRDIAEMSLEIMVTMLRPIAETGMTAAVMATTPEGTIVRDPAVDDICSKYYLRLLQDIFFVLTDGEHKSGFKQQALVLSLLVGMVARGHVKVPLAISAAATGEPTTLTDVESARTIVSSELGVSCPTENIPNNIFLRCHIRGMLSRAFGHVSERAINVFVTGVFDLYSDTDKFKHHLRDFLIQIKESSGGTDDFFLEEREKELEAEKLAQQETAIRIAGPLQ